jgi:DNA-binding MarR family transcriptional regulator
MVSRKNVRNTHIGNQIRNLHGALIDIVSVINSPRRDETLIRNAEIPLDRALFPLLVVVDMYGPIGVVDLAERVGRDYTTVSRQIAKLQSLDLVERNPDTKDRRSRESVITAKGKAMTSAVDAAREKMLSRVFKAWDSRKVDEFVRLLRKFADAIKCS